VTTAGRARNSCASRAGTVDISSSTAISLLRVVPVLSSLALLSLYNSLVAPAKPHPAIHRSFPRRQLPLAIPARLDPAVRTRQKQHTVDQFSTRLSQISRSFFPQTKLQTSGSIQRSTPCPPIRASPAPTGRDHLCPPRGPWHLTSSA
jgi:hypothetical protein